ncbi:hypothetical protein [Dactylosporangium sp. CA-233914]|uniref:hypothetical protein n=1 Tax=Dactylosporangium sp. CA-233914 TaxID=3239934 RepID=UPI003D907F6D
MSGPLRLPKLRQAIADALWQASATDLPDICSSYGLDSGEESEAMFSKRAYVKSRIKHFTLPRLVDLAQKVLEEYEHQPLTEMLQMVGAQGVDGDFRNLIFAANGPKPKIIFTDAINNVIRIVDNEEYCLSYDKPLEPHGLTWSELNSWWAGVTGLGSGDERVAASSLYQRLIESLDRGLPESERPGPEYLMFHEYCALCAERGFDMPALIPQVYLHYDPYVRRKFMVESGQPKRQRMDFLLLLPNRNRVVIEIDGVQHYSHDGVPSPRLYADMVAEDRRLRLAGYEIHRFGGYELRKNSPSARPLVRQFFVDLLERYKLEPGRQR